MLKVVHNLRGATIVLVFALCFSALFALSLGEGAIAETRDVKTRVTIKPSLLLDIPSNNITMNLDPSSHAFEERDLTIKVGTNNLYGYKLFLTTPNDDTDLVNVADNTKTIPNLTSSTSVADFPVNNWGYRFTPNATSSTGNYGVFTSSDSTPIMSSDVPVNEQASTLGFAAKIDYTKPAGLYNLKLNFKAVPTVTTNYMQDIAADPTLAASVCTEEPTVVIDKRDEQAYTIRRINGTCWMVENLQFTGTTMDSTTTNIAPEYTPSNPYVATYYDLETDGTTGGTCNQNSGAYDYSCIHRGDITIQNTPIDSSVSSTTISTVWYNYAAATAGTITGNPNTNPTEYDICPKGWKLPSDADVLSIGDMTNTYIPEFNPTSGGRYYNGVIHNGDTDRSYWWGTATKNNRERRFLYYNNLDPSAPYLGGPGGWYRSSGNYIRCVMDDFGINDLTYMQDFATLNESGNAAKKAQVLDSMELNSTTGYTLKDVRDNNEYTITKIGTASDSNVWMTKNLAFSWDSSNPTQKQVTITPADTNINTTTTFTMYDVLGDYANHCSNTERYSNSCVHSGYDHDTGEKTVWYNFAAVTADTVKGDSISADSVYDLCPAAWRLPSLAEGQKITSYKNVFKPVFSGGYWANALNGYDTYGVYFTSSMYDSGKQYVIYYDGTYFTAGYRNLNRGDALSIRCILK